MAKAMLPQFNESDVLYIYKERWFTGFAPCLFHNLFSLACCKGNSANGGLRASACREFEKTDKVKNPKNIWILSIAGSDISSQGHNLSEFKYSPGDAIYLAKVTGAMSWREYSGKFKFSPVETEDRSGRRDAIYFCNEKNEICWQKNGFHNEEFKATDCATESENPCDRRQIILSNEYYILKPGMQLNYKASRNFIYNGIKTTELATRAKENPEFFMYRKNPFSNQEENKNSGCNACGKGKK